MLAPRGRGSDDENDDLESGLEFDHISQFEPQEVDARQRRRQLIEAQRREDEEYEGECGYLLMRALRGKTVGRRLRRKLFKYGLFQLFCGFPLFILAILEVENFTNTSQFDTARFGSSLIALTWCVSLPSFLLGIASMTAFKNWASLVTNRRLLVDLMRIYTAALLIIFILAVWLACAMFLTFRKVKNWGANVTLQSMLPYFICTLLFLLPYLPVLFLYTLDISYLTDEVERGGVIEELDPPADAKDMSDVTLVQSFVFVCGMPCIICIQLCDLVNAVKRAYERHYRDNPLFSCPNISICPDTRKIYTADTKADKQKKKSTLWRRVYRTIMRCFKGAKTKKNAQAAAVATPEALELRDLENDREKEEREKRESILRDQEEERQRYAQKESEELKEYERQQQLLLEEEMRRLEEERQRELHAAQNAAEQDVNRWMSVLTVTDFKSLWSTLNTNGSFQCNLKSPPNQTQLTEHLKRQGFHVVFAVSPNAADIEIGICNVRPMGQEAWFMARFLVSNNSFSAVMKSQDATLVPSLVKKFALAKVLKIDTPGK